MKQQNQQLLKSLKQTHEQTIKLLMKRTKPSKHSRYIPQDVKIQVVIRDNGMCQSPGCFATTIFPSSISILIQRGVVMM